LPRCTVPTDGDPRKPNAPGSSGVHLPFGASRRIGVRRRFVGEFVPYEAGSGRRAVREKDV
jgi:hypothetical protein